MNTTIFSAVCGVLIAALAGCTTTPAGGGGAAPACAIAPTQNGVDLRINCTLAGPLPNTRFDPFAAGSACGLNSFTLFGQTVGTPIVLIYGQNGDDGDARVRVGGVVGNGTHAGSVGKDGPPNCTTIVGPTAAVATAFLGNYVGLVDKGRTPMCIFQSRLQFDSFTQTLSVGLSLDISGLTRERTQAALLSRLDLETATAVNRLLSPASLPLSAAAVARSGRCPGGDWQPFSGG